MRVSHVILRVSSIERSVAFYRDRVGLAVLSSSPAFAFLDGDSIRLALNRIDDVPPDSSLTEIVLEVDDVAAAHRRMADAGVEFRVEPRQVMEDGERSLLAADFRDPDGHLWSLTGWVTA